MPTTSQRLQAYRTDQRTSAAYDSHGTELCLYNPVTGALLHNVAMAPTDAATFAAHGLPANDVTQPLEYFLRALSFTEPAVELATADNVPAEVWARVLKSCAVPTVIPEA